MHVPKRGHLPARDGNYLCLLRREVAAHLRFRCCPRDSSGFKLSPAFQSLVTTTAAVPISGDHCEEGFDCRLRIEYAVTSAGKLDRSFARLREAFGKGGTGDNKTLDDARIQSCEDGQWRNL